MKGGWARAISPVFIEAFAALESSGNLLNAKLLVRQGLKRRDGGRYETRGTCGAVCHGDVDGLR
jgi:hypothetical protein